MRFLNAGSFANAKRFSDEYDVEYDAKANKLRNFKLFIIMDTDDSSSELKSAYISGELFKGHWMSDYIVPIYNIENLEDVLVKAKLLEKRISSTEKGRVYSRIFPINREKLGKDTVEQVSAFREAISGIAETNMSDLVDYCLGLLEQFYD